jgi:hypothetical protein
LLGAFKSHASLIISVFAMCEYAFFSAFFFLSTRNRIFKNLMLIASILYLSFLGIQLYSANTNFDFWAALITVILIVIYSVFFFYEHVNSPTTLIIYQSYAFWIVVGCIIYLAGTLFLFLYTADLKDKQSSLLWSINIAFEILKNIFFSIAFVIAKNNKKIAAIEDFEHTNMFENPF